MVVWERGAVVVERQVWRGVVATATALIVVEDSEDQLVTYTAPGAEFGFTEHRLPTPSGRHPRYPGPAWRGHGALTVIRAGAACSVIHFWRGEIRAFAGWYLNIQEPIRPTAIGFDTQDLELDIVIGADRQWEVKDDELLDQRVREGRWTEPEVARIRRIGSRIIEQHLVPNRWWWDESWAYWQPDPEWDAPGLPAGWADPPADRIG